MGRLSDPQDDREYPRYVSDADDGLDQLPDTAWPAEHERIRTLDRFPRLGVQDVPPPPPIEQKSFNAVLLLGTVVLVAAVSSYAAVTLLPRWSGLAFTYSRADASVTQRPAAAPPVAPQAFVPSVTSANAAPAIAPVQGTVPAASMPLHEDGLPKAEMRTANINPTAPAPRTPSTVQGVTDTEIRLGMAAPFGGPSREMGRQLKLGIETAFNQANDNGGVYGRQLKLVTADDGYEPTRTLDAMKELYEKDKVFGFIENYGSPTALVSVPYALERHALYFGAFTGAPSLRHDPPDRYVFNYRAGYAEEANALIHYLVKVRRLRPEEIGVLTQQDAYGEAGWDGVTKAVRALRGGDSANILRMTYPRNTVDVDAAVAQLRRQRPVIKAVVLVATVRPAAKFIEKTRDLYPDMIYTTISGVGSTGLANELMLLGPRFADGVVCTQVTPPVDSYASVALNYKKALAKYFPGEPADYMSLEAYLTANILIEGLRRVGPTFDTEALVDTLEGLRNYELGLGPKVAFDPSDHQAMHKVWGTQLDKSGQYHAVDLE